MSQRLFGDGVLGLLALYGELWRLSVVGSCAFLTSKKAEDICMYQSVSVALLVYFLFSYMG